MSNVKPMPLHMCKSVVKTPPTGTAEPLAENTDCEMVYMKRTSGSGIVYWGGSNVTTSNGIPIDVGELVIVPVRNLNEIYVIADTGSLSLRVYHGRSE
jgi:hypothetical protein